MNSTAEQYKLEKKLLERKLINPVTKYNYRQLKKSLHQRGIKLFCVQYPLRSVEMLETMLEPAGNIYFVDNEFSFRRAIVENGYEEYFSDQTKKGGFMFNSL